PITSGRTPVAIGSSVPRWPTRRVFASLRSLFTTSCDVHPSGLSTTMIPSIGSACELFQDLRQNAAHDLKTLSAELVQGVFVVMPIRIVRTVIVVNQIQGVHSATQKRNVVIFDCATVFEEVFAVSQAIGCLPNQLSEGSRRIHI